MIKIEQIKRNWLWHHQNSIKLRKIKSVLYSLCFLTIISCNSSLSSEKIEDIALIGADIKITQNPTDSKDSWMTVNLFDKQRKIIRNDSVKIIVNNVETGLSHRQGLYYTDESEYYIEAVPVNQMYTVEIKLTDGKIYFLGSIHVLSEENIENIACDEQGDLNKDTVIRWKDLINIDEMTIHTSTLLKNSNTKDKNYSSRDVIVKKIGSNGEYIISKSGYFDSQSTVAGFQLKFTATRFGELNPKLLENSNISITTAIEKNINLEKEE